jgi:uncharacterized protein YifE (UPF0438 family)
MASLKQQHEIAVANRLIKNLALPATFVREGDPTKNEPDVIYSYQRGLLGIEVATAYTDDEEATQVWNLARGKIKAPHGTLVYTWKGTEPDKKMCACIQQEIDEKCARKVYSGVDRVWLCVEQIPGISSDSDAVLECVKQLRVPTGHGFEKIFLHYLLPLEDNEWHSIELWPEQPQMG